MAGYMIVRMTVSDPGGFQKYRDAVLPLLQKRGAKMMVRGGVEVLEGDDQGKDLVIFEFPSVAAVHAFWDDPDYVPVKALRQGVAVMDVWAAPSV